jgi:hypothetical protein
VNRARRSTKALRIGYNVVTFVISARLGSRSSFSLRAPTTIDTTFGVCRKVSRGGDDIQ